MEIIIADYLTETTARCGVIAVTHRTPALALARKLIKAGHDPASILQMRWPKTGVLSVRATLESFAALTVEENAIRGPVFRPYRPNRYGARNTSVTTPPRHAPRPCP